MRLELTGPGRLLLRDHESASIPPGHCRLNVRYCGICRTDAKMWRQGHRDLILPRIMGHELVGLDEQGRAQVPWPGTACGQCRHCLAGRENLCDDMRIMGFHFDGGFANTVVVPEANLLPVPAAIPLHLYCFAEPLGCVLNALQWLNLGRGSRVAIFGGGTVGLLAALICRLRGAEVVVLEKNAQKIAKAEPFCQATAITCCRETMASSFDAVLNACPDHIAFCQAMVKLEKGGRYAFFSGLGKNEHVETNLLNLIHYKEFMVQGAYGLTSGQMAEALALIQSQHRVLSLLVEALLAPEEVPAHLDRVLDGCVFKYIIDWSRGQDRTSGQATASVPVRQESVQACQLFPSLTITAPDPALLPAAQHRIDDKTKPLGALGRLEDLAVRMALIQGTLEPRIQERGILVFAADHGIAEEGVSAYPAEVTGQMVDNFLDGGAAINVLCAHHQTRLRIVDVGVRTDIRPRPGLIERKIRRGTRNFALEPAMTREEAIQALEVGIQCFHQLHGEHHLQIIGLGEMGIANTSSATALICAATAMDPRTATGRGTGMDDAGMDHKIKVLTRALALHRVDPQDSLGLLCAFGGLEIAGMAGAALAAAAAGVAVVLDGLISTAAGLVAHGLEPAIQGYLISGHRSEEPAQLGALAAMGLTPILDLDMRLGEGTGAVLTMDLAAAACRIMAEMASFDSAGISRPQKQR